MKPYAAQLFSAGTFRWSSASPLPSETDRLLVRTLVAAVCGSDLHVVDQGWGVRDLPADPGYPGHESIVEVLDDPSGTLPHGMRALAVPPAHDSRAFATHQLVDRAALLPLEPDDAPTRMIFAQQLGTVIQGLNVFWESSLRGLTVAVVGAGTAGTMFVHEAVRRGAAQVIVSDPDPHRRSVATAFGASSAVPAGELATTVSHETDEVGAPLVVEASGTDGGRNEAIASLRQDGVLGMFGLPQRLGPSPIDIGALFARRARLVTTHGTQSEPGLTAFREALTQIRGQQFDPSLYTIATYPLSAVNAAFTAARQRDRVHKALLVAGSS